MEKKPRQHPDIKYIKALCDNDPVLIQEIYQKYSNKILIYVKKNTGSTKDAEDIFQEALVDIYEQGKKEDFRLTCPFDAYLYFICKNKWLNQLRKKKNSEVTIDNVEQYKDEDFLLTLAEETIVANSRKQLFEQMFEKLGDSCKNILRLNWKGISLDEVAKQLNLSYGYTRKKKVECIAKLTKLVKEHPSYKKLMD